MRRSLLPLEHPLDLAFAAPSHIAVLRALLDSKEGMSGRAVAREAAINHQACALALRRLETTGIVRRLGSGKTQLVRLNVENLLVQEVLLPCLRAERELLPKMRKELGNRLGTAALSLTIFGSAARRQAGPDSDLDLLVLVPAGKESQALELVRAVAETFKSRHGVRLSPLVLSPRAAKSRRHAALLRNILQEGVELLPRTAAQVLS